MKIQIHYHSILTHPTGEKIPDDYKGIADVERTLTGITISFNHPLYGKMSFVVRGNKLDLVRNEQIISLERDVLRPVAYQSPYGTIQMQGKLLELSLSQEVLKGRYELYDHTSLLTHNHFVIRMMLSN